MYVYIYIYIHVCICLICPSPVSAPANGYLVLQGNRPSGTAQSKHFPKLLARKRLGIRWAKYPFSRCQLYIAVSQRVRLRTLLRLTGRFL